MNVNEGATRKENRFGLLLLHARAETYLISPPGARSTRYLTRVLKVARRDVRDMRDTRGRVHRFDRELLRGKNAKMTGIEMRIYAKRANSREIHLIYCRQKIVSNFFYTKENSTKEKNKISTHRSRAVFLRFDFSREGKTSTPRQSARPVEKARPRSRFSRLARPRRKGMEFCLCARV